MKRYCLFNLCFATMIFSACQGQFSKAKKTYESDGFKQYWYAGKAEINSYSLNQSRYGEQHKGKAVLIFVTEDFSKQKQVKLDNTSQAENDKINVLKLNFIKNFITGIYPYAMMQSVFTPVARSKYPNSLKTTMSSQEWCGHVFTQLNLNEKEFNISSFSYFEQEGDVNTSIKKILLEDEIWNIIRLEHAALPLGDIQILPGLFFTRLNHVKLEPQSAFATKKETENVITYSIDLPALKRNLSIRFEKELPHKILGWEEKFEVDGIKQYTSALIDKTLVIDYWTKNKNEFQYLRDSLNLLH